MEPHLNDVDTATGTVGDQRPASNSVPGSLLLSLASGAIVVLSGLLAGLSSISTDLQSFIWLPSGVALALALWFGWRGILGAGIGGGAIGWIFATGQNADIMVVNIVTLSSAAGAAVEAGVGAVLFRRFISDQPEIESGGSLLRPRSILSVGARRRHMRLPLRTRRTLRR